MNPTPSRKLLVVNQYYVPDQASTGQLAAEICSSLVQQGLEVHVVTGQPSYTASAREAPAHEVLDGVTVHRVSLSGSRGRENVVTRMLGYSRFMLRGYRAAKRLAKSGSFDAVLTFHNPPFLGLIGARLASKFGLRFVYCPYDILPDVLAATGWLRLPGPAFAAWHALNRWIFRNASAVIVLGEGMKRTLVEGKGVPEAKVRVIPVWARPELTPAPPPADVRRELGVGEEELLLLYSGNLGIMHPVDPVLDAAAALAGRPVRFLFIGEGPKRPHLVARVEQEKLSNVSTLPYQPADRYAKLLAAADACLVTLDFGLERLCVPSRAYTCLSAGRPVIAYMAPDSDVGRLATEEGCGWNVTTPQALAALAERLLENRAQLAEKGQRAREVYVGRYQRDQTIQAYAEAVRGEAVQESRVESRE